VSPALLAGMERNVESILDRPLIICVIAFFSLWFAGWYGNRRGRRHAGLTEEERSDFGVVQAATLTLLGLIIGFSFSMAAGRYDLRKTYEEAEANAIGTEYVRADLLPEADAAQVRALLRQYTDLRIRFYSTRSLDDLRQINADTAKVQDQLWKAASQPVIAAPVPLRTLTVSGMNDVINSQGYTQAAWWNRIPLAAWYLMFGIGIFSSALVGYGARAGRTRLFMILPLVVALSFWLIADIDSPRGGMIRVRPQNLQSLRAGLAPQ
jgi:hypothetical protein